MLILQLLETLMILLPSFGGKAQIENKLPQNQNQRRHLKSPENLLLAMMVPILDLRP